ncbi:MAG: 6-phosphogluconolactonase [Acidimicrobiales bacterium]
MTQSSEGPQLRNEGWRAPDLVVDRLNVYVHPSSADLARAAADQAAAAIRTAVENHGVANAMFATGNSQLEFTEALVSESFDIPWHRVVIFHMDEYVGIEPDHPAGFAKWIRERIVQRVRPLRAHLIDSSADPEEECERYASLLKDNPLDLCCLGIGENGHLAFNDPPDADLSDPRDLRVVTLEESCRLQQVNEGHFPQVSAVPAQAITVTVPALLRAARVIAVVPESRKAGPVFSALNGPVSSACPASALRTKLDAALHLDPGSASRIRS